MKVFVSLVIAISWVCFSNQVSFGQQGQEILVNGGFENPQTNTLNYGNNVQSWVSIAPWVITNPATQGTAGGLNLVRVDGAPPPTYSGGPDVDASGQPGFRHYLDIHDGANVIWQSFKPLCNGDVVFKGFFSNRGSPGTGRIRILQGEGTQGTQLAQTSIAANSLNWTEAQAAVNVTANTTYTFAVNMDNNVNFDEGSVRYVESCPLAENPETTYEPCCPPWSVSTLEQSIFYSSNGSMSGPYTVKFQPQASLNTQMQAYINYLHAMNPCFTEISIGFAVFPAGNGPSPGPRGPMVGGSGGSRYIIWRPNTSPPAFISPAADFFPANFNLMPGTWYTINTWMYPNRGCARFYPENCEIREISFRVQVIAGAIQSTPSNQGRRVETRSTPRSNETAPKLEFKSPPDKGVVPKDIKRN